ncbi:micronuclear linker histone polyprotein-like [Lineus longissimus]|uniref:micronuclear linker histone polyprotein-like n=1 Tax=Lineus longissimus TaxID=88925 RepID=UPI00315DBD2C
MFRSVCREFDSVQDEYAQFEFMYSSKAKEIFFKHSDLKHNYQKTVRSLDIEKQAVKKAFENDQLRARRASSDYKNRKEQIVQDKIINDLTRQQLMRNQSPAYRHEDDNRKRQLLSSSSLSEEPPAIATVDEKGDATFLNQKDRDATFLTQKESDATFLTQRRQTQSAPPRKISVLNDPTRPEETLMRQRKVALQETTVNLQKKMDSFLNRIDQFVKGEHLQPAHKSKVSFQLSVPPETEYTRKKTFIRSQSAAAIVTKAKAADSKSRRDVLEETCDPEANDKFDEDIKMSSSNGRRTSISRARIDELVYGKSGPSTMVSPNPTTPGERRRSLTFITDALVPERRETLSASSRKKQTKSSKQIFSENKEKIMDAWLAFTSTDNSLEGMKKLGRMAARGREEYNVARKKSLVSSDAYQQFESFKKRRGSSSRRASTASVDRKKRHVSLPAFSNGLGERLVPSNGLMNDKLLQGYTTKEKIKEEQFKEIDVEETGVEKDVDTCNLDGNSGAANTAEIVDKEGATTETKSIETCFDDESNDADGVNVVELTIQAVEEANAMWKKLHGSGKEPSTDGQTGAWVKGGTDGRKNGKGSPSEFRRKGIVVKKPQ